LARTAAALWFVAQPQWAWTQMYTRDPARARPLEVEVLPALSTANVRELLKAVLPLQQLTPLEAMDLVIGSGHMTVDTFGKPDLPTFLAWK
jgi:hypothetical protein